jgi:hypothetical protein
MVLLLCFHRHAVVCENVLHRLKSEVRVDIALRDVGSLTLKVSVRITLLWRRVASNLMTRMCRVHLLPQA